MRRPSLYSRGGGDLGINMTPMIDVVFLLLVFFVWNTNLRPLEYLLPGAVTAPKNEVKGSGAVTEPPSEEEDFEDVIVRIKWEGVPHWFINDVRLASLAELKQRLAAVAKVNLDAPVTLHPDPEVPLGDMIDVYDVARGLGLRKLRFATNTPLGGPP